MPGWQYPKTKKQPFTFNLHDEEISDPYQWLESSDAPEVQEWVEKQNQFFRKLLDKQVDTQIFVQELKPIYRRTTFSNPAVYSGKYFWSERQPNQNQSVLYVKHGLKGEPEVLVDPNEIGDDGTTSVYWWYPSPQGNYLAYGLIEGGDELAELHVMEVGSGEVLETFPYAYNPKLCWLSDESGFYYNRNFPPEEVPKGEERYHQRVFLHTLGQSYDKDQLIFGEDRHKEELYGLSLSLDDSYLAIHPRRNWRQNDLYLYDVEANELQPLVEDSDAKYSLNFLEEKMVLKTNKEANNFKVLQASLEDWPKSIQKWPELIPEGKYPLEGLSASKDRLLAVYNENVTSLIKVFDHDGEYISQLPLPENSSLSGISAHRRELEFFFGATTFTMPKVSYRYNPKTSEISEYRRQKNPLNPDDYAIKQEWYQSEDGTEVPMFIVHHKDVKRSSDNPTILYGYGGFNISVTPSFMGHYAPWLKRGGVFAVANIRGGSEFGEDWHEAGTLENKQNTFDDFIAAAEYLTKQGYTDNDRLGIMGGSNGGLTVGAAMVQRPELFKAVVARVPVLDMLRFHKFLIASRWAHEWGHPDNPEEFAWLKRWSPYYNVDPDQEYPATLFTTANKDTRVEPLHARKMAARLQEINQKNPVFLRTEMEAGHGPGASLTQRLNKQADILTFMAWHLGLDIG